jgi:GNAT superfamily N-acetyltransferase
VTGIHIRKARLSDAPEVAAVMRASIRRLACGFYSPRQIAAWSSLPPLYHLWAMTAGGEEYLVAEESGRLVGYAARRGREISAVFVERRRARAGVGGALLSRLERNARRGGARIVVTRAALSGAPFYRARGFSGGRRIRVPLPDGGALVALLLWKRLSPRPRQTTDRSRF